MSKKNIIILVSVILLVCVAGGISFVFYFLSDRIKYPELSNEEKCFLYKSEFVDLGLSVLWRTHNLCAMSPDECGIKFAWGDTFVYGHDRFRNYPFFALANCTDAENSPRLVTKYNRYGVYSRDVEGAGSWDPRVKMEYSAKKAELVLASVINGNSVLRDTFDTLLPEDDVASCALFGSRMPTDTEWKELKNECDWTPCSFNGVCGYKITSKVNHNFIYLPAVSVDYLSYKSILNEYNDGFYWSSTLANTYDGTSGWAKALIFQLPDGNKKFQIIDLHSVYRSDGLYIRPVKNK